MQNQIESLTQDNEVADIAEEITGTAEGAYTVLLERREAALAAAFAPLDAEKENLIKEIRAIEQAAKALEDLLPAQARIAQAESDRLIVAGDAEAAQLKTLEMQRAQNAPAEMRRRQDAISLRLTEIDREKQDVARAIFESWYLEVQQVVRAAEHGLFITLLDGLSTSFLEYQNRTGTGGTLDRPFSFLVKAAHLQMLTAHERSPEWQSGQRWYKGRQ